jgi:hypothetical protein
MTTSMAKAKATDVKMLFRLVGHRHFRRNEKVREKIAGDSMREPFTTNGVSAQHPLDGMQEGDTGFRGWQRPSDRENCAALFEA